MLNVPEKHAFFIVVCSMLLLAGCSSNPEDEFLEKLNADEGKNLCYNPKSILSLLLLGEEAGDQYLAVRSGSVMNFYKKEQNKGKGMLGKLGQTGYVNMGMPPVKLSYQYVDYDRYKLTEKGRKQFLWGKGLCVGDRLATSVVEYTEPSDLMGRTFTEVNFKYDLRFNDAVSELGLEEKLKSEFDLNGEQKAVFVKTNKGWRIEKGWR